MTESELDIVGHSLGVDVYSARRSKLKRDRRLPKKFYRNYFNAREGHSDWESLLNLTERGIMWRRPGESPYFHVTERGKEEFKTQFKEEVTEKK